MSLEACVGAFEKDKTFLLCVVWVLALGARRLTESFTTSVEAAPLLSCLLHGDEKGSGFHGNFLGCLVTLKDYSAVSVELLLGDLPHPPSTRP